MKGSRLGRTEGSNCDESGEASGVGGCHVNATGCDCRREPLLRMLNRDITPVRSEALRLLTK